eukprot:scaffold363_cov331-Pavlova_lutheri.AAC.67
MEEARTCRPKGKRRTSESEQRSVREVPSRDERNAWHGKNDRVNERNVAEPRQEADDKNATYLELEPASGEGTRWNRTSTGWNATSGQVLRLRGRGRRLPIGWVQSGTERRTSGSRRRWCRRHRRSCSRHQSRGRQAEGCGGQGGLQPVRGRKRPGDRPPRASGRRRCQVRRQPPANVWR